MCVNVTAIASVNNMGGIMRSETGNNIACRIWHFCNENELCVSATYIPVKKVDHESIILQDATEWKLHPELFHKIVDKFGKLSMEIFASRINSLVKLCALASRIKGYGS